MKARKESYKTSSKELERVYSETFIKAVEEAIEQSQTTWKRQSERWKSCVTVSRRGG